MPPPPVNTLHCLILQSKTDLKEIPHGVTYYFINSKRRFFVYFRHYEQMISSIKVLTKKNIRFYRRQSLLPDREEYQQHVYHCNYRIKKQDLRKTLYSNTPYNDPKLFFDKYQHAKQKYQPNPQHFTQKKQKIPQKESSIIENKDAMVDQQQAQNKKKMNDLKFQGIVNNKQLLIGIFQALNFIN